MARRWLVCGVAVVLMATLSQRAAAQDAAADLPKGWIVAAPPGFFGEPSTLRKLMNATDGIAAPDRVRADGPYVELGNMITGSGWISAGPGYRQHLFSGRAVVSGSAAVSWKAYQVVQGSFELPHLAHDHVSLGSQVMYQDLRQVDYFGFGNDSRESDGSAYRFKNIDVLGYGTYRATPWMLVSGRVGWIPTPDLLEAEGPRLTHPSTVHVFDDSSAPGLSSPPLFLHGDASVTLDFCNHVGHPTAGGVFRAAIADYSDRDGGAYSFRRYELEASHVSPLGTWRWLLALHAWEVFSDTTAGHEVPFFLMPSLGGQNTLRGYTDYRFHDRDMQVFNVESRWGLFAHLDLAAFYDTGKVAARAGDLDFSHMKHAYGVGLRLQNASSTLMRLDVGHSTEGWHVFFKLNDPFRRSKPAFGRSSVIPFVS